MFGHDSCTFSFGSIAAHSANAVFTDTCDTLIHFLGKTKTALNVILHGISMEWVRVKKRKVCLH